MDSSRAYAQLEKAILIGELKPRERLVEFDLAGRLGLSRTPVREALRRLGERGLVHILPRRGAVVADLSSDEVENIFEVRVCLETLAARLAFAAAGPALIARAARLEAACAALVAGGDVLALMAADDAFHDAIYSAAKNPCLLELIRQLRLRVSLLRFNAWSRPHRIERSLAEHRQMVETLRGGNAGRLASLMRRHLGPAKEAYLLHAAPQGRGPTAGGERRPRTRPARSRA